MSSHRKSLQWKNTFRDDPLLTVELSVFSPRQLISNLRSRLSARSVQKKSFNWSRAAESVNSGGKSGIGSWRLRPAT